MKAAISVSIIMAVAIATYWAVGAGRQIYIAAKYGAHCYKSGEHMPAMKYPIQFETKEQCEQFLKAKMSVTNQ